MTSGLLLLTTDGTAAHRLMHPRFAVPRTYWLRAHGHGVTELRAALTRPPAIDGRPVRVVDFRVRPVQRSVEVELTLAEGRQRIVRRLAEALGLKVEWLHRVAYGPVRLGRLAEGKYRRLAAHEVAAIERLEAPAGLDGDNAIFSGWAGRLRHDRHDRTGPGPGGDPEDVPSHPAGPPHPPPRSGGAA